MPGIAVVLVLGLILTMGQLWWIPHSRARTVGIVSTCLLTLMASVMALKIQNPAPEPNALEREPIEDQFFEHTPAPPPPPEGKEPHPLTPTVLDEPVEPLGC